MTDIIPRDLQLEDRCLTSKHNAEIDALRKRIEGIQFESEEDASSMKKRSTLLKNNCRM